MATRVTQRATRADRLHSVKRALAALEALATRPDGATPKELSQALGLHLSTCYRLLNTLVDAGYVIRCSGGGLFRLGPRIAYINHGYLAGVRPPPGAMPFAQALSLATGETAMLNQLLGDEVVISAAVPGSRPGAQPPDYVGVSIPAHLLATGKVLLARLSEGQLDAYLARQAERPASPFPVRNPDALRAELRRVREHGYAVDRGESHPANCCAAAPLASRNGAASTALAVVAPCARFLREEPALVAAVLAAARAIDTLQMPPPLETGSAIGHDSPEAAARASIDAAIAAALEALSRVG